MPEDGIDEENVRRKEFNYDGADAFLDVVFLRPIGLIGTIVGTALFIGLSPFTAMATIAPPHDAFSFMADGTAHGSGKLIFCPTLRNMVMLRTL